MSLMNRVWMVGLAGFVLGGCGNVCKDMAAAEEECGGEYTDDDLSECQDALDNCSKDDEEAIGEYVDCYADACASGGDEFAAALGCIAHFSGISEECANGM